MNSNVSSNENAPHVLPFSSLPQSFIPFPSSSDETSDYINLLRCSPIHQKPLDTQSRTLTRASQVELRHRRSLARLAQSPLVRKDAQRKLKPKDAGTSGRRLRTRKFDMQLLATVYRSVASRLARGRADGSHDTYGTQEDPEMDDIMEAQDRLFVERLCEAMVEFGYSPLPTVAPYAPHTELSDSPFLCDPLPSSSEFVSTMSPMSPEDFPVLTMPQLVATIMLRRRERARRAANRERSIPNGDVSKQRSSPLARDVR